MEMVEEDVYTGNLLSQWARAFKSLYRNTFWNVTPFEIHVNTVLTGEHFDEERAVYNLKARRRQ